MDSDVRLLVWHAHHSEQVFRHIYVASIVNGHCQVRVQADSRVFETFPTLGAHTRVVDISSSGKTVALVTESILTIHRYRREDIDTRFAAAIRHIFVSDVTLVVTLENAVGFAALQDFPKVTPLDLSPFPDVNPLAAVRLRSGNVWVLDGTSNTCLMCPAMRGAWRRLDEFFDLPMQEPFTMVLLGESTVAVVGRHDVYLFRDDLTLACSVRLPETITRARGSDSNGLLYLSVVCADGTVAEHGLVVPLSFGGSLAWQPADSPNTTHPTTVACHVVSPREPLVGHVPGPLSGGMNLPTDAALAPVLGTVQLPPASLAIRSILDCRTSFIPFFVPSAKPFPTPPTLAGPGNGVLQAGAPPPPPPSAAAPSVATAMAHAPTDPSPALGGTDMQGILPSSPTTITHSHPGHVTEDASDPGAGVGIGAGAGGAPASPSSPLRRSARKRRASGPPPDQPRGKRRRTAGGAGEAAAVDAAARPPPTDLPPEMIILGREIEKRILEYMPFAALKARAAANFDRFPDGYVHVLPKDTKQDPRCRFNAQCDLHTGQIYVREASGGFDVLVSKTVFELCNLSRKKELDKALLDARDAWDYSVLMHVIEHQSVLEHVNLMAHALEENPNWDRAMQHYANMMERWDSAYSVVSHQKLKFHFQFYVNDYLRLHRRKLIADAQGKVLNPEDKSGQILIRISKVPDLDVLFRVAASVNRGWMAEIYCPEPLLRAMPRVTVGLFGHCRVGKTFFANLLLERNPVCAAVPHTAGVSLTQVRDFTLVDCEGFDAPVREMTMECMEDRLRTEQWTQTLAFSLTELPVYVVSHMTLPDQRQIEHLSHQLLLRQQLRVKVANEMIQKDVPGWREAYPELARALISSDPPEMVILHNYASARSQDALDRMLQSDLMTTGTAEDRAAEVAADGWIASEQAGKQPPQVLYKESQWKSVPGVLFKHVFLCGHESDPGKKHNPNAVQFVQHWAATHVQKWGLDRARFDALATVEGIANQHILPCALDPRGAVLGEGRVDLHAGAWVRPFLRPLEEDPDAAPRGGASRSSREKAANTTATLAAVAARKAKVSRARASTLGRKPTASPAKPKQARSTKRSTKERGAAAGASKRRSGEHSLTAAAAAVAGADPMDGVEGTTPAQTAHGSVADEEEEEVEPEEEDLAEPMEEITTARGRRRSSTGGARAEGGNPRRRRSSGAATIAPPVLAGAARGRGRF